MKHKFTFIDLFSGIGGFHIGLTKLGGECVFASEIDEAAIETYIKNFKLKPHGDICNIKSEEIPNFDVLCAGFPCQSFSNVGQKGGLKDPRGALIYQVIRILKDCQPKAFILENVKGLLTNNAGKTFETIKNKLIKSGYRVYCQVLEAKDYGLPQIRKRVLFVGVRKDIDTIFEFPTPIGCKKTLSKIMRGKTERSYAFTIRIGGRHSGINNKFNWDCYIVDGTPRYITTEECLELQGFPRNFYLAGKKDLQFKQVGNAIPTVFPYYIGLQLIKLGII